MAPHKRIFFLLVSSIPIQLGYHFWPDWAFVLGRRIDYLSPTLYLTDILVCLVLLTYCLSLRSRAAGEAIPRGLAMTLLCIPIFLFAILNILFASNRPVAIYGWIKVLEFAALGWYVVNTKPRLVHMTTALAVGVMFSSILALIQFVLQHSIGGLLWWFGERTFDVATVGIARASLCVPFGKSGCVQVLRSYATFPHPNTLAAFIVITMPLFVTGFFDRTCFGVRKSLLAGAIVFGFLGLIVTFSRIALAIYGAEMLVLMRRYRVVYLFVIACVVYAATLAAIVSSIRLTESSVVRRVQLNQAAVMMVRQSPLFGVGLNNFLVDLPRTSIFRESHYLQPAHSVYMLILSETGIIGVVFCIGFAWVLVRFHKSALYPQAPLVISLCALGVLGLVDHYPLTLQQGQLLSVILVSRMFSPVQ